MSEPKLTQFERNVMARACERIRGEHPALNPDEVAGAMELVFPGYTFRVSERPCGLSPQLVCEQTDQSVFTF